MWYSTITFYKAEKKCIDQPRKYCLIHANIFLFNPLLCFLHFPAVHSRLLHTSCRRSGFIFLTVCTSRWLYTLSVPLTVSEKVCKSDRSFKQSRVNFYGTFTNKKLRDPFHSFAHENWERKTRFPHYTFIF